MPSVRVLLRALAVAVAVAGTAAEDFGNVAETVAPTVMAAPIAPEPSTATETTAPIAPVPVVVTETTTPIATVPVIVTETTAPIATVPVNATETTAPIAPEPNATATTAPIAPEPNATAVLPVISSSGSGTDEPPPFDGLCDAIHNKDIVGFDLANVRTKNIFECVPVCRNTKGCVTMTWSDYNGGTCWLKSHAGKQIDKPGVFATYCLFNKSQVCNPYKDIDFVGNDIANKPAKSVDQCCDICNEYSGCSAYSWSDFNGGTCWLKKSVGHVIAKPGVISSSTVQLSGAVCPFEYDTDFVDNDIGNKPAADAGVCCSLCKANPACKAYSWSNYNSGTCWMKSGKGKAIPAKGVISAALVGP